MVDLKEIDQLLDKYVEKEGMLIQVLEDVQNRLHWLPEEALVRVSEKLGVPLSQAYSVATFYKAFSLVPRGRHLVSVCLGTACHVRGGPKILDKCEQVLGIKAGETSTDMRYSMEKVNCLGCCALGPVVMVDEEIHGNLVTSSMKGILDSYQ